jgi:ABC-type sugar transport system ATPase subunit
LHLGAIPGAISGSGRIVAIENFGTETNLHVSLQGQIVVMVVEPSQAPRVGEEVTVSCAPADIYVFDRDDGRMLSIGL